MSIKDLQGYESVLTPEQSRQLAEAKVAVRRRFPESVGIMLADEKFRVIGMREGAWYYVSNGTFATQFDAWINAMIRVGAARWEDDWWKDFHKMGGVEPAAETPASDTAKPAIIRKVYLCARYSRRDEMAAIRDVLREYGFAVTSRWLGSDRPESTDPSGRAPDEYREKWSGFDLEDVCAADTVVSFTEPPDAKASRGGRHVEFGIAAALKKRLIVVGYRENVFHHMPRVEFYPDASAMLTVVFGIAGAGGMPDCSCKFIDKPGFKCVNCGRIEPGCATAPSPDKVNHPSHYGGGFNPYEAIKVINAWNLGFNLGNAVKYICRAGKKSGESAKDDLEKARFYVAWELEHGTEYRDKLPSHRLRRWLVRLAWAVPLSLLLADWCVLRLNAVLDAIGGGR